MSHPALLKVTAILLAICTQGCTPNVVKEPYPVEVVREVYRPIPDEYTRELETPQLPGTITVLDLVQHIKSWQAWGKTVNEHRAALKKLTDGP